MESLTLITHITIILIIGILCTILSHKLKIPNILLLIVSGLILGSAKTGGVKLIEFPETFITTLAILTLVMIVFDSTSRLKIRDVTSLSADSTKLSLLFLFLSAIVLGFATDWIFGINNLYASIIFGVLMSGTDPSTVLMIFQGKSSKVINFLKIESIVNTPLVVIIPFVILDFYDSVATTGSLTITTILAQIGPFLTKFVVGIGAGIIVGLILLKLMRQKYEGSTSPIALITIALLTYILSENLHGSGVLAVTTLGLMFGNVYVKERGHLQEFSEFLSNVLYILVFILIGIKLNIPFTKSYILHSLGLFILFTFIRFASVMLTFRGNNKFNFKEKIFISLNISKGIAVAVMAFSLITIPLFKGTILLNLMLTFIIYSILFTAIALIFSKYLIKTNNVDLSLMNEQITEKNKKIAQREVLKAELKEEIEEEIKRDLGISLKKNIKSVKTKENITN